MTYETTISGRKFLLKMKKTEARSLSQAMSKLTNIRLYHKDMYGIIGENENSTVIYSLFGPNNKLSNEEDFQKEFNSFVAGISVILTKDDLPTILAKAENLFLKYLPVIDRRQTQEEKRKVTEVNERYRKEREEEEKEFRVKFCQGEKTLPVQENNICIYLAITFNNSDHMSDYYCPHALIGNDMLLAIVKKQPERESLARKILARYPELNSHTWKWYTENYSGGHGNYLMSEFFDKMKCNAAYDLRSEVSIRYEICFSSYRKEMYVYKDYPGIEIKSEETLTSEIPSTSGKIVMRLNNEFNGVELIFQEKPPRELLDLLKDNKFRWSPNKELWYAKQNESTISLAKKIAGILD